MVPKLLVRGMAAGLAAGLLAFVFAYLVGEPPLEEAIRFEQQMAVQGGEAAHSHVEERTVQRTVGLLAGNVLIGVGLGGLLSLVFAYAYGRLSRHGARVTAAILAAAAFVTVTLVPFTKYPANPPGAASAESLDQRTVLFFAMIAIGIFAAVAGVRVGRQYAARIGAWNASILGGGVFIALIALAQAILPDVREVPTGFPAEALYQFRIASLGVGATIWLTIGLVFGALADRLVRSPSAGS